MLLDFPAETGDFCASPGTSSLLHGKRSEVVSDPNDAAREVLDEEAFRHLLARETDRATRYQDFFSVCLVKPDAKETAHSIPAEIQQAVAKKIAEFLRSTDVVACVQDVAAILLLHTASTDALRVAERIRANIGNVAFPGTPGGPPRRVTLSVGEVSFPRDGSNDRTLLSRAEANLREAARRGGDTIVHADDTAS
jgi:diguanylate cyclase (GGDEF)-like protein